MTDHELLKRYADSHSQDAFGDLVRRHINLVYGIARRQMPADADDITQAVFLLLAQKAHQAARCRSLPGWLFRVTRYCCLNVRRRVTRRRIHELEAGRMTTGTPDTGQRETLLQLLDDSLAGLP